VNVSGERGGEKKKEKERKKENEGKRRRDTTISRHGNKPSFDLHGRYNRRERGSDGGDDLCHYYARGIRAARPAIFPPRDISRPRAMIDRYRTHLGRVFRQSLISVRKKTRARATDELTEERTKAFNRDANARVLSLSLSLSLSLDAVACCSALIRASGLSENARSCKVLTGRLAVLFPSLAISRLAYYARRTR